mmetsp:Transcript_5307/g.12576  ORF Transcript_5307/g.12576 Transcript_5307/m.12576 type:complete len:200 (+) Transcript_5307:2-601(+)
MVDALATLTLPNGTKLVAAGGSVLDFTGDAIVNAANEGGVTGFGVDEAINQAAGVVEIKEARRKFGGIPTGTARTTPAFNHTRVKFIIHACGPVYREKFGHPKQSEEDLAAKDRLLLATYVDSLREAREHGVTTICFCLISAGVFRGERPLASIISSAVDGIKQGVYDGLESVTLVGYTSEEKTVLTDVFRDVAQVPSG